MIKVAVFQQNGSGKNKIAGLFRFGRDRFETVIYSIDQGLPPIIDDSEPYLPGRLEADLVLDYLKHPDLSHDLANYCVKKGIPIVASGKKHRIKGALTPPT